jgi:hypothetical protein
MMLRALRGHASGTMTMRHHAAILLVGTFGATAGACRVTQGHDRDGSSGSASPAGQTRRGSPRQSVPWWWRELRPFVAAGFAIFAVVITVAGTFATDDSHSLQHYIVGLAAAVACLLPNRRSEHVTSLVPPLAGFGLGALAFVLALAGGVLSAHTITEASSAWLCLLVTMLLYGGWLAGRARR